MHFGTASYAPGNGANASQQQQQQKTSHTTQPQSSASVNADQQFSAIQPLVLPFGLPGYSTQPVMQLARDTSIQGKTKRAQVKNACVNCQKACKKCDDGRPCQRCIKFALTETCVNSVRKKRMKGIKRGPYKKRKQGDTASSTKAATPNSSVIASNLPEPTSQTASSSQNNHVLAFPQFQPGTYHPFQGVSYQGSISIIPQAYMVPTSVHQSYPASASMLSYHTAMNMLSPQQGQPSPSIYMSPKPSGPVDSQQPAQPETVGQEQHCQEHLRSTLKEENSAIDQENVVDSDDERSKLNILSKLCSAVLSPIGPSKVEASDKPQPQDYAEPSAPMAVDTVTNQSTPPPSRGQSCETSNELASQLEKKDNTL